MNFADRLKMIRKRRGMTLDDLSKAIDSTKSTLSRYETGCRIPNIDFVERVATYFNVSIDYLMGRTSYPNTALITHLPDELVEEGIDALEVFKDIDIMNLTEEEIREIINLSKKLKNRS